MRQRHEDQPCCAHIVSVPLKFIFQPIPPHGGCAFSVRKEQCAGCCFSPLSVERSTPDEHRLLWEGKGLAQAMERPGRREWVEWVPASVPERGCVGENEEEGGCCASRELLAQRAQLVL